MPPWWGPSPASTTHSSSSHATCPSFRWAYARYTGGAPTGTFGPSYKTSPDTTPGDFPFRAFRGSELEGAGYGVQPHPTLSIKH